MKVKEKYNISGMELKNRIVVPPICFNYATKTGIPSERLVECYRALAEGGCSMIVIGGTAVCDQGKGTDRNIVLQTDESLDRIKEIISICHQYDVRIGMQFHHAGGQANPVFTGMEAVSPSGTFCKAIGVQSRELTVEEIQVIKHDFISSALKTYQLGADFVEIHCAHGYLLHQFLSRYTNQRTDNYGGSFENRVRLICEILESIREKTELPFKIGIRISGEDYLENGINFEENKKIIELIGNNVDYVSVSAGIYETSARKHEAMRRGEFFEYSSGIKSITDKPVIGVGKIYSIQEAESMLLANKCDLVAVGRAQIADPNFVSKSFANKTVNECIECDGCSFLRDGKEHVDCPIMGSL